jgi:PTH1 family peptidyl-tRNA hydrolase
LGPALVSAETTVGGEAAMFVLPQAYMNRSGAAMTALFERFGAGPGDLVVVYDEIALPLGRIRIRQKGSAGGHNGIKSAISACGSDEFLRVRVGIKPERPIGDLKEFVLSPIDRGDRALIESAEELAARAVETLVEGGFEKAMAAFNGIDLRRESGVN